MENRKKIIDLLSKHKDGLKSGQIAEITGINKKEVDKEMDRLKKEDILVSPKRCFWTVKKVNQ